MSTTEEVELKRGKKVWEVREGMFSFDCPGCGYGHTFFTKNGPVDERGHEHLWTFNGDLDSPTIMPSLGVNMSMPKHRCHSWVKNGTIEFLHDSHHSLKGQTVPIPDLEEDDPDRFKS